MEQDIWVDHLGGRTDHWLAQKYGIPIKTVRGIIADRRSKFPRQTEERAMRAFVRNAVARGLSDRSIQRNVWDIYRMTVTAADIRAIPLADFSQTSESPLRALGAHRRARKSKTGKHTADLSARVTVALCASTEDFLPKFSEEAKKLTRQTPPASKKFALVREAEETAQFLAVDAMQDLVDALLDEI